MGWTVIITLAHQKETSMKHWASVMLLVAGCAAPAAILWPITDFRSYGVLFSAMATMVVLIGLGLFVLLPRIEPREPASGDEADWWKSGKDTPWSRN